jgi:hypothetical protein
MWQDQCLRAHNGHRYLEQCISYHMKHSDAPSQPAVTVHGPSAHLAHRPHNPHH